MNNFTNLFPMTPAQSWTFILMLFVACALFAYLIWYLDVAVQLAIWNCKIVGAKGILYAISGRECYEIRKESVIEVVRNEEFGYRATTTDGEQNYHYIIITSKTDAGNKVYDEAINLAGDDKMLKDALLPESRVKSYFALKNKEDGTEQEFLVVYLKRNSPTDVEEALNRYFEEEFQAACRESRNIA